jgi:5-methylcytosine-specific restriction protein A
MERPLHPCPEPGCPNLVRSRNRSARCELHRVVNPYDADWRRVRSEHLTWFPWCQLALCRAPAREVDHIIPVRAGGARLDHRNLRSLCIDCHRKITPREYDVRPRANFRRSRERAHRPR